MTNSRSYLIGVALICLASLAWSSAGLFIKLVDLPPLHIAAARSLIAGFFLLSVAWWSARGTGFRYRVNRWTLWTAVCYTFTVTLFVTANKLTTSANAVFLQYTAPVYVILISYFVLREKIYPTEVITIVVSLVGMVLFFLEDEKSTAVIGNIIGILSGVAFALLQIVIKRSETSGVDRVQSDLHGITNLALSNFVNVAILLPVMGAVSTFSATDNFLVSLVGQQVRYSANDVLGLLFLGIVQLGCGYLFFAKGAKHISSVEIAIYTLLEPVCNPIWTFMGTGEIPGFWPLMGGLLVLGAMIFNTVARKNSPDSKNGGRPHIFLCGFMGSGKTTVGKLLAANLQRPFYDTDAAVEKKAGLTIAEIFDQQGESSFRRMENEVIASLAAVKNPQIIALGGGSLLNEGNLDVVRKRGLLVFLEVSENEIKIRVKTNQQRPLYLKHGFTELYKARLPGYLAADERIKTDGKTPEQIAVEIKKNRYSLKNNRLNGAITA